MKLPINIFYPKLVGRSFKKHFIDQNGKQIIVHPKAKCEIHLSSLAIERVFYDEDDYPMRTVDEIRDFNRRMRQRDKYQWLENQSKVKYTLSKWGQEVVNILNEKKDIKNAHIMQKLYNQKGYNGNATHIKEFFKSKDGKRFYENKLINDGGYWSLKD